jgi:benzodiazapine receptor
VGFVGLCLLVGVSGAALTAGSVHSWYPALHRPPGTPPDWLFAPTWTTLYVLIGIAAWLVWQRGGPTRVLRLWGWQLAANALWAPVFFGMRSLPGGLVVLVMLLVLAAATIAGFARLRPLAAWLMAPYLAWCCYAAYLNAGFWWLNPG